MVRLEDVVVLTPKISPTHAELLIVASAAGDHAAAPVSLRGAVAGPHCRYARTLPLRIPVIVSPRGWDHPVRTTVRIPEPCFWEPQHPFCYDLELGLYCGDERRDEVRLRFGIRHLQVRGGSLRLNGREIWIRGLGGSGAGASAAGWCGGDGVTWLTARSRELVAEADETGATIMHMLREEVADVCRDVEELRNHPSLMMWVAAPGTAGSRAIAAIRHRDLSRPIAQLVPPGGTIDEQADVALLAAAPGECPEGVCGKPQIVLWGDPLRDSPWSEAEFADRVAEASNRLAAVPNLAGIIL